MTSEAPLQQPLQGETLGEMIKRLREVKGLSQTDLAKRLGLSDYRTIWRWETGQDEVPTKYSLGLRRELGIPELLTRPAHPDEWARLKGRLRRGEREAG